MKKRTVGFAFFCATCRNRIVSSQLFHRSNEPFVPPEYLKKFSENKAAQNEYRQKLTALWLMKKKAEMVIKQCDEIHDGLTNYSENKSAIRTRDSKSEPAISELEFLKKFRPQISTQFFGDCQNHGRILALKELVRLSPEALPILSTYGSFDVLERSNGLLNNPPDEKRFAARFHFDLFGLGCRRPDRAKADSVLSGFHRDTGNLE